MGIYLLKVNNKNFRARCVNCSKLTKKRHKSHLTDIATLRNLNFALVSSLLTLKRFHTFSQHFTVEIEECCWLGLPTGINVQTSKIMKHPRTGANHITLAKRIKLQLQKKLVSNLRSVQNVYEKSQYLRKHFERTFTIFIEIFVL